MHSEIIIQDYPDISPFSSIFNQKNGEIILTRWGL